MYVRYGIPHRDILHTLNRPGAVHSANPKSLEARVTPTEQSVVVAPLLLNPEDKVTISILTSGGPPSFSPHARIAGVAEIRLDDSQGMN